MYVYMCVYIYMIVYQHLICQHNINLRKFDVHNINLYVLNLPCTKFDLLCYLFFVFFVELEREIKYKSHEIINKYVNSHFFFFLSLLFSSFFSLTWRNVERQNLQYPILCYLEYPSSTTMVNLFVDKQVLWLVEQISQRFKAAAYLKSRIKSLTFG